MSKTGHRGYGFWTVFWKFKGMILLRWISAALTGRGELHSISLLQGDIGFDWTVSPFTEWPTLKRAKIVKRIIIDFGGVVHFSLAISCLVPCNRRKWRSIWMRETPAGPSLKFNWKWKCSLEWEQRESWPKKKTFFPRRTIDRKSCPTSWPWQHAVRHLQQPETSRVR